jgi:hypothetical protein
LLLRKRSLSETVNDQLKTISQSDHARHRNIVNFFVNLVAGLRAYTYQAKTPSLPIRMPPRKSLPIFVLSFRRTQGKAWLFSQRCGALHTPAEAEQPPCHGRTLRLKLNQYEP